MPQTGLHGLAALAVKKYMPNRKWLILGIILGNTTPDLDFIAVAGVTLMDLSTEGLHRTFSHSLFTVILVIVLLSLTALFTRKSWMLNLGLGLGFGILMHIILDLLLWFNGVELLWPISSWLNLWSGYTPPAWWTKLMMPVEFLFQALFFVALLSLAKKRNTDAEFLPVLRVLIYIEIILFLGFTAVVYTVDKGITVIFGIPYLLSLLLTAWVVIRLRRTVDG